jgi:signal transduction histidine kinase
MVNMKKHSEASLVAIGFKKDDKALNIQYSDNGVGHDLKAKQKSNGLLNVENRILSINGRVKFESEKGKGFKAKLKIPV